jgi:hypothetical protein
MSRQTVEFIAFGVSYRTKEFGAAESFAFLDRLDTLQPVDMLRYTEVLTEGGQWARLSDPQNINAYVRDICRALKAHEVLQALITLVRELNFGFLNTWKPVPIPSRFVSNAEHRKLDHIAPIMSRLISEHLASLNELQEFYSLNDAFDMYDVFANENLNKALSTEAASKEARAAAKQR